MTGRRERKTRARMAYRLELGCGHIAYALDDEAHREGLVRECHAHGGYTRILNSVELGFKVPYEESGIPMKYHEPA